MTEGIRNGTNYHASDDNGSNCGSNEWKAAMVKVLEKDATITGSNCVGGERSG